jgi:hypothetical protein
VQLPSNPRLPATARQICLPPSTIPGHGCLMRSITGDADGNEHRNRRDK